MMIPKVECPCRHCAVVLVFDRNRAGELVDCPNCSQQTALFIKEPLRMPRSIVPPGPPTAAKMVGAGCAVIAGIVGLVMLILSVWTGLRSNPAVEAVHAGQRREREAFEIAKQFIVERYPGVQDFASFKDCIVTQDGATYRVAIKVMGQNAFGGPVRNIVGVEMEYRDGHWNLVGFQQR